MCVCVFDNTLKELETRVKDGTAASFEKKLDWKTCP